MMETVFAGPGGAASIRPQIVLFINPAGDVEEQYKMMSSLRIQWKIRLKYKNEKFLP